jgi:hypothetical protein
VADFIHMDAAVDIDSAVPEAMATVKVVNSDDAPRGTSLFTLNFQHQIRILP